MCRITGLVAQVKMKIFTELLGHPVQNIFFALIKKIVLQTIKLNFSWTVSEAFLCAQLFKDTLVFTISCIATRKPVNRLNITY